MSLVWVRKRGEPIADFQGTPFETGFQLELSPIINTLFNLDLSLFLVKFRIFINPTFDSSIS